MSMHGNPISGRWLAAMLLISVLLHGCSSVTRPETATSSPAGADRAVAALTEDIEALYLAWHALDQTHKDIKFVERGFLFDADDRQLGYIQKAALYVQDASIRIHHRWEQLAVLHYIRPEMLRDYITLSVTALASAQAEIGYDLMFLDVYTASIDNADMLREFSRARESIQKNMDVLDRIALKLRPLANEAAAASRL